MRLPKATLVSKTPSPSPPAPPRPHGRTLLITKGGNVAGVAAQESVDLFASFSGIRSALENITVVQAQIDSALNAVRGDHRLDHAQLSTFVTSQASLLQGAIDERFDAQQSAAVYQYHTQQELSQAQQEQLSANFSRMEREMTGMHSELSAATSTLQRQAACGATGMVWNGAACVRLSVPTDAQLINCSAAVLGQQRYHRANKMLEACIDPPIWSEAATSVIGTLSNPAPSCVQIKAADYGSGVYYVMPAGSNTPFQVFCENDRLGGGWTLINKIAPAHNSRWLYASSLWTAATSTWSHPGAMNLGTGDYKSPAYSRLPFTQVRIFMGNSLGDGFVENTGAKASLHALLNGARINSRYSRNSFMTAMSAAGTNPGNWNNQPNCNAMGFNLQINNQHRCRWGLIMKSVQLLSFSNPTNCETCLLSDPPTPLPVAHCRRCARPDLR